MFHRFAVAAASAVCVGAQSTPTDVFQKAPPDIESGLRARVAHFLQAHVDGKFRQALDVIAADSQDAYFEMDKRRYISFEIVKIDYSENFTKAKVLTQIELDWRPMARAQTMRVKAPYLMTWKQEDGQWFWYIVKSKEWETPFGEMKGGDPNDPAAKVLSAIQNMDGKAILAQLKTSKTDVTLRSWEASSDTVEITNGMPGLVSLKPASSGVSGLKLLLDKETLQPGETAKLTFQYTPELKTARPNAQELVRVEPTGHLLRFNVAFAVHPDVQRELDKLKK